MERKQEGNEAQQPYCYFAVDLMRPYRTYNCKYRTCRIGKQERVKQTDSEKGACVDEKAHNKLHIEYNGRPKNYKRYFKRA